NKDFMNLSDKKNQQDIRLFYSIARGTALTALVISLTVSFIIIVNYVQLKQADPLNSEVLIMLKERLSQTPQDELLKNEIRALHMLTRKAYFTGNWQIKSGAYIIIISLIILSISLKVIRAVRRKFPDPDKLPGYPNFFAKSTSIQYSILTGGGLLLGIAVILAFITDTNLNSLGNPSDLDKLIDKPLVNNGIWAGFRGKSGNGISDYENVPNSWNGTSGKNINWKTAIPLKGYSSPIIVSGKLYVTGGNKIERKVFCLDAKTGEILWNRIVRNMVRLEDNFNFDWVDENTGFAAPTMATDGQRVVAIFATGDMACFRLNGDLIWTMNIGAPDNHYAHSSSLIINDNLCFVQLDHHEGAKLLAIDMINGSTTWEVKRKVISWASPICVDTGGRQELILADSKTVTPYNPENGEVYWQEECLSGEMGPSPAYADGIVFVANEYAKASGIRINLNSPENPSDIIWQITDNLPNTASPIASDGLVLLASSRGIVSMLDALTGELYWEQNFGKGFYSSPILVGDNVYLTDLNGKTTIFKMTRVLEISADNELGESVSCTPALQDGEIFMRGSDHVFSIKNEPIQ
ncbi:MAG: PQQ-binding-like beta-propeller repeat protein, partial [Candidatus Marinimicrobia bacterium]|nr:PQQ-binding-like beta-propeller repeat protein [Candidatus Neomarinimicrobiota bacterium]